MDRNYFLSYGHRIAFLLLLAAVGKFNTKLISVTIGKIELPHCTGTNDHRCSNDFPAYQWSGNENENDLSVLHYMSDGQKTDCGFYCNSPGYHLLFFSKTNICISVLKALKLGGIQSKWAYSLLNYKLNIFLTSQMVRKFYVSSIQLIDGFKFIIKIPDKPSHTFIL